MTAADLPAAAVEAIREEFGGAKVVSVTPVSGGMINRAARVQISTGWTLFVKWRPDAPAGMFAAEAAGLEELGRETAWAVRVPDVQAFGEDFLLLEWREPCRPRDSEEFTARLAGGLAALHRTTLRTGSGRKHRPYGHEIDGYIGALPQKNTPRTTDWPAFYRDCRLLPQIEMARAAGRLTPDRERLLISLLNCLPALLDGMPRESSLLHGDLWSGNFLCSVHDGEDTPYLIDPAVYNGPREMEMAYVELFGGFPPGFIAAYQEHFPLDEGYARRRPLHQLYHLLNHWNHFGEPYGERSAQVCRHYLRDDA